MTPFDGIVLAGGRSSRMRELGSEIDKTRLELGDRMLVEIAVAAVSGARTRIVVGPSSNGRPAFTDVRWVREDPVGGGPVAALAAGLAVTTAPVVVLLAADLPFVTTATVGTLLDVLEEPDPIAAVAAVAVDDQDRDQPLLAAYRAGALRVALPEPPAGGRLRDVLDALARAGELRRVPLPGTPPAWWDCDSPGAWEQARMWS